MSGYTFHPEALRDLDEIWEYIALDSLDAADRVIGEILKAVETAVLFPGAGHSRSDLTALPLRFLVVREYLVVYAPSEEPLWVIAVLHGRRNPRVMAALLRGRS